MTTKQTIRLLSYAAFAGVLAMSIGCDESDPTAATDWTILVRANPGTVNIDPNLGQTEGTTEVQASLFDAEGIPQPDIAITFTTTDGVLESGGAPRKTDAYGIARDVLTLIESSAETVEVTASSSSLAERVQIKKTVGALNEDPQAAVIGIPKFDVQGADARPEFPVTFDGSLSTDADDDPITLYRWEITSTNADTDKPNPIVIEDPAFSSIEFPGAFPAFHKEQDLTVVLRVSDQPVVSGQPAVFSPKVFTDQYQIRFCAGVVNQAPVAIISGPDTIIQSGLPGQNVNIQLDGTLSSDPEGYPLASYNWACGNGATPQLSNPPGKAVCTYKVESATVTYTATLVVSDRGDNSTNPSGGFCGAKNSAEASVKVQIQPLQ